MYKPIHSTSTVSVAVSFKNATGKMRFTLTNDYLFRAVLQRSQKALRGLICSILGLKHEEIVSIEIKNPIELGKSIEAKDFILDTRVLLNNNTIINLEMQVLNLGNWTERSLQYLCRSFDHLNSGQDYLEVKPVIQVCFLDFTLFEGYEEFFSTYMFTNIKNHLIYSDKLKLHVVDLKCIDMATEEDKCLEIDSWARLFKANTWEEIKMLAANNTFIEEAAETAYQLSEEEHIRLQCEAREDFYRQQMYIQKKQKRLERELIENATALEESRAALEESKAALEKSKVALKEKDTEIERLKEELARRNEGDKVNEVV